MISGLPIQHDPLASCQVCWWKKPYCGEATPLTRIRHGYASAGNHAPAREFRLLVEELRCSSDLFLAYFAPWRLINSLISHPTQLPSL
jgi:hypothetical protein